MGYTSTLGNTHDSGTRHSAALLFKRWRWVAVVFFVFVVESWRAPTVSLAQTVPVAGERGALIQVEEIDSLSLEAIAERMAVAGVPGAPRYGVTLYRILYQTIGYDGVPTQASGALAVPQGLTEPAPLLSFQHGTVTARHRVPSEEGFDLVSMGLGTSGYLTALPDYLGLGASPGHHPYVHARSLGTAVVDLLRAVRTVCEGLEISWNEQLFLMGYSEGGFATMAAHREIQQHHADEFTVTASAPMAGPYNLSVVMADQILSPDAYPAPGYLPYTLLAFDRVYNLFGNMEEVVRGAYAPFLDQWFNGSKAMSYINKQLPDVPAEILLPDFVATFRDDPHHPLREALAANDVHNWTPEAPMRLYHCKGDDQVSFRNAEMAMEAFREHGANHVELAELNFGDHRRCAAPALFLGKLWFDEFKERADPAPLQATLKIVRADAFE